MTDVISVKTVIVCEMLTGVWALFLRQPKVMFERHSDGFSPASVQTLARSRTDILYKRLPGQFAVRLYADDRH